MSKCFADKRGSCTALKQKNCEGCNFFKTQKQFEEGVRKAKTRLIRLGRSSYYEFYK